MDEALVMVGLAGLLLVLGIGGSLFGFEVGIALLVGGAAGIAAALLLARRSQDHSPWHGPSRSVALLGTCSLIIGLASCLLGGILGGPALGPRMAGAFWEGTAGKAAEIARDRASAAAGSVADLSHRGVAHVENGLAGARDRARETAAGLGSAAREHLPGLKPKKEAPDATAEVAPPPASDEAGKPSRLRTWGTPLGEAYRWAKAEGGRVIGRNPLPAGGAQGTEAQPPAPAP